MTINTITDDFDAALRATVLALAERKKPLPIIFAAPVVEAFQPSHTLCDKSP